MTVTTTTPAAATRSGRRASTRSLQGIADASLDDAVTWAPARAADHEALARVHDPRYLEAIERFAAAGGGHLDSDTPVSPGSFDTAALAAGCGLVAIEALDRGDADAAFVAVRPPGHHATRERGQGFCLLNNIAVAGAALAERGERVLIVDWDVHHGNGTQDIFWDDPRVLYVSTHQSPFYPGTGSASETGGASAAGTTINFPFPAGTTGDAALAAIDEVVAPAVERFSPTWVLVSAGFDAHRDDPLANLAWSAGDYARSRAGSPSSRPRAVGSSRSSKVATTSTRCGTRWRPRCRPWRATPSPPSRRPRVDRVGRPSISSPGSAWNSRSPIPERIAA